MFVNIIAPLIAMLVIISYMATSDIVINAVDTKLKFEKVKYVYPIERIIADATEQLCQEDSTTCKNNESAGVITLTFSDLVGYLPDNFSSDNLNGGTFGNIEIFNNYTTLRINHNIPDQYSRKIYLTYFKGREFGVAPLCQSGTVDTACSDENVVHDYATTLATRSALK